jgi:hypothetical protein
METKRHSDFTPSLGPRKILRGEHLGPRQACQATAGDFLVDAIDGRDCKCAQTPVRAERAGEWSKQLDCRAAMLQAISIGKGIPMLEPWIIDEIRRREEERRRGSRPQLELPVPDPRWPTEGDCDDRHGEQGDKAPERGVVIIGM